MNPTMPRAKVKTAIRVIHSDLESPRATNASGGLEAASMMAQIEVPRNKTSNVTRVVDTWTAQLSWKMLSCCVPHREGHSSEYRLVVSARTGTFPCTAATDWPRRRLRFVGNRTATFVVSDVRRQSDA